LAGNWLAASGAVGVAAKAAAAAGTVAVVPSCRSSLTQGCLSAKSAGTDQILAIPYRKLWKT